MFDRDSEYSAVNEFIKNVEMSPAYKPNRLVGPLTLGIQLRNQLACTVI